MEPGNSNQTANLKSFHYLENGEITFSIFNTLKSELTLDSGSYRVNYLDYPENRVQVLQDKDQELLPLHSFPDREKLDSLFGSFFNKKVTNKMTELGMLHKVGVLLHGQEGTGKSTIMKYYYNKFIKEHNAIVFHITSPRFIESKWEFITKIRRIQKNPIIVVFDEIDEVFLDPRYEAAYKSILDGKLSIDNTIFFGSTNYLDRIPPAIKNRPSRFKYVLNIEGIQGVEDVKSILNVMLDKNYTSEQIAAMAEELKGSTLDTIKQHALDKLMEIKSYSMGKKKIGFNK